MTDSNTQQEQYEEGELTPADDGHIYDPDNETVVINPAQPDQRTVPADKFFKNNSHIMPEKEDFEIDVEHVESIFEEQFEGLDIEIAHREIGNGPQYAIKTYKEGTTVQKTESQWYTKEEFEGFCEGLKHLHTIFRKAEEVRSEEE